MSIHLAGQAVQTPPALTADTDDWGPDGSANANTLLISSTSAVALKGLAGGTPKRELRLVNEGDHDITLTANASSSLSANRFKVADDRVLIPGQAIDLLYSDSITGWVAAGGGGGDLSFTRDATTLTVASSGGNDAVLPSATTALAGLMTAADKVKLGQWVDVTTFGATGDGVANDTTAVAAAYAATPVGGTLFFPPNKTYRIQQQQIRKNIRVVAKGATFVQIADVPVLQWFPTALETKINISAFATVDWTAPGASSSTSVTQVTTATALSVVAGDVVKIASEDAITGGESVNQRRAEHAIVGEISGTTIHLTSRLRETYTTNPQIAKQSTLECHLEGGTFTADAAGAAANWNAQPLRVQNCRKVRITDFDIHDTHAAAMGIINCFDVSISNGSLRNLNNDPSDNQYGYGILVESSTLGRISNVSGRNLRHLVTSGTKQSVSAFEDRGRPAHWVVANCTGIGNHSSSFDTHSTAYDWQFIGCKSVGSFAGESSSGTGFTFRGHNVRAIACSSSRERIGFRVYSEVAGGCRDATLTNCEAIDCTDEALSVHNQHATPLTGTTLIEGGRFHTVGTTAFRALNAGTVRMRGVTLGVTNATAGASAVAVAQESTVELADCYLDMAGASGGDLVPIRTEGSSTGAVRAERVRIVGGSSIATGLLDAGATDLIATAVEITPTPTAVHSGWDSAAAPTYVTI